MKRVSLDKLNELLLALSSDCAVYAPVRKDEKDVYFSKWTSGADVDLSVLKTSRSAKDLFFPQVEDIASFKTEGKRISVIAGTPDGGKFTVFGVRACDARSFSILDKVFLVDPIDPYYKTRRDNSTVITLACSAPEETCFCSVFSIDPSSPEGDVTTWVKDGFLYWQSNTDKGFNAEKKASSLLEDCDETAVDEAKRHTKEIVSKMPLANLDLSRFTPDELLPVFNSPMWTSLSKACLGCGTCTFVCPTCQCYDIRDFDCGHKIQRFRCWDSCMYSDFTKMAHGNPRKSQVERFRQRFMHKLIYFPANNNGEYGCVGCGRCLSKCPISMNIVKVIKTLGAEEK